MRSADTAPARISCGRTFRRSRALGHGEHFAAPSSYGTTAPKSSSFPRCALLNGSGRLKANVDGTDDKRLRVLIANERRDRLELLAEVVIGLGHDVIAREIEVSEVPHRQPGRAPTSRWSGSG